MKSRNYIVIDPFVNDTIKSVSSYYNVIVYHTFIDFKKVIDTTPMDVDSILCTSEALAYSSTSVRALKELLSQPFLHLEGTILYLVDDESVDIDKANSVIDDNRIILYKSKVDFDSIIGFITSDARDANETTSSVVTYRFRKDEYARRKALQAFNAEKKDEELYDPLSELSKVPPIEIPEQIYLSGITSTLTYHVVGDLSPRRSYITLLLAQYLAIDGPVVLVESDTTYHTLTDAIIKSGIDAEIVEVADLVSDSEKVFADVLSTTKKIVIFTSSRIDAYNYNFMQSLVFGRLHGKFKYFIQEHEIASAPWGVSYTLVVGNTVPEVIKSLQQVRNRKGTPIKIVSVREAMLGQVNISEKEVKYLADELLSDEDNEVEVSVLQLYGLKIGGHYDLRSILTKGYERQD